MNRNVASGLNLLKKGIVAFILLNLWNPDGEKGFPVGIVSESKL